MAQRERKEDAGGETIAAVATACGEGGIGIVRISGPRAEAVLKAVFMPAAGHPMPPRKLMYGRVEDDGALVDEALAVFMKGPGTYTAEDVAEIHCHGGTVSLRKVLEAVFRQGVRPAEPGEFTRRAFLNGRLDLAQAEAVIDLIRAAGDRSHEAALEQLEGGLSKEVGKVREALLDLLVKLAVNIDYPDEDIEELTAAETKESLSQIGDMIEKLISSADTGRILREGLSVVIVGRPNVGKSSLMNALLRESRAIVTEIPGTTRDTIEEMVSVRGIPVRLTDTAGIRETEDQVERMGIARSRDALRKADLLIFMLDGSEKLTEEDLSLAEELKDRPALILINKNDLPQKLEEETISALLPRAEKRTISLAGEAETEPVEEAIEKLVYGGRVPRQQRSVVINARHKNLLEQAADAVRDAEGQAAAGAPPELLEIDVREAWERLGEILGETVSDTITDEVFSRFCLGK